MVDSRKVKIIGGWQHFMDSSERISLTVGERKQLPFDISEAGPGKNIAADSVITYLTLVLLNLDMHCLYKQCRSRSVGF